MTKAKKTFFFLKNFFTKNKFNIHKIAFAALIIASVSILIFISLYYQKSLDRINANKYEKEFEMIAKKKVLSVSEVEKYYTKIGPEKIIDILDQDKYCHSKGHIIGKVIYEKTKDINKSISICNSKCTTGCIHGVINGIMGNNEYTHVTEDDLKTKLISVCNDKATRKFIPFGGCIHGIGHAVTLLNNYDIDKSLEFCKQLDNGGQTYYCATGVYMERAREFGEVDSKYDKYYPCNSKPYPSACYRYKMYSIFSNNELKNAVEFCKSINDSAERIGCFHGLGFRFYKLVESKTNSLGDVCRDGTFDENRACIEGLIGSLSVISKTQAENACTGVEKNLQKSCLDAVKVSNFGMERDFHLYMTP